MIFKSLAMRGFFVTNNLVIITIQRMIMTINLSNFRSVVYIQIELYYMYNTTRL